LASSRTARLAVPVLVVLVVVMMVVPLPAAVLDVLIAGNIAMSLVVLLVSMQVRKPLEFAVFPTLVLVGTILRLALNVSSTRLVLRDGFAGHVIEAFGGIVIGGSLVIGLVVFAILVIIQLTVVTNGAARVAEVGARFTLDAMPGKQMAIDADLNSGLIDEDEARRRRKEVSAEPTSTARWTAARRFVKGDAIAAVIITFVNLIGGFAIGCCRRGWPRDANQRRTAAQRRRRPGLADPRAADVGRDRHHRHPLGERRRRRQRPRGQLSRTATRCGSAAAPWSRCADPGHAQAAVRSRGARSTPRRCAPPQATGPPRP
jgi:flagellar biosynthesis component FlhA